MGTSSEKTKVKVSIKKKLTAMWKVSQTIYNNIRLTIWNIQEKHSNLNLNHHKILNIAWFWWPYVKAYLIPW